MKTLFDNKDGFDALVDAISIVFVDKIFGRFNGSLRKAFDDKGIKGEKLTKIMGNVLKSQTNYLSETIETALSETLKNRNNKKK